MRKILGCFIIIMIMITSQIFAGTVYHVDATNGSDSNSGTSQGIAWKTINKVNNSYFNPGDSILFKRGEVWREQLIVPSSGSSGSPITFSAYGSGDDPIIDGSSIASDWHQYKGSTYVQENINPQQSWTRVGMVRVDGTTILQYNSDKDNLSQGEYHHNTTDDDLYICLNGDMNPWEHIIKYDDKYASIIATGKDYITVDGLHLKGGFDGIRIQDGCNHWIIQNCTIRYTANKGIKLQGDNGEMTYNTMQNNDIRYCGDGTGALGSSFGIQVTSDVANPSSNNIIQNNLIRDTDEGAFSLRHADSNIYRYNECHRTGESCLFMNGSDSNEFYYNIFDHDGDNNNDYVFYIFNGSINNEIYNNVIISNGNDAGLFCDATSTGTKFKNNIYYGSARCIWILNGAENDFVSDHNCLYVTGGTFARWRGTNYATLANYQSTSGQDTNSINLAPLFINPSTHDFHLLPSSLCINAGMDVSLTQDYDGNTVPNGWAVDIGVYEYQGSVSPPLSAEINASPMSGYVPLAVSFTGSASGGTAPYSYSWNFGDGQSSSSQNPAHTYSSAGNYIAILTVTDSKSSTATDSLTINVQEKTTSLAASASASPTSGQVPLSVSFTGSASGGTAPYTYSWNFGDGSSSSSQNPSHTYSSAGTYTAILTVTDSTTTQASASTTITAQSQIPGLAASCTASPTSGDIPLTVNFTGTAAGGISPYAYSWNFGDGTSSTEQNPFHTYTQAGSYSATFTVTDSTASQASASSAITASSPVHEVTVPDTPEGPSTGAPGVSYTYTTGGASCSQGHSVEYYFDWGDGAYSSWSSSTSASHIWSAAGTYAVKVQARCSVNPGVTSLWSEAKTVSLKESPNFQLYISSATDSPAPGQGGSTNPDTGSYPYPAGNTAQVTALPAANYRFSKWTGDISGSDSYNSEITFNMDQDKSISALFCTQCGDVNGDLSITPADAQDAFEMFLGIISIATETQKENADVNCDGTAAEPNITPADAQAIFEKFLGISELPGDCSCRSRADASSTAFTQNNRSQTAPLEIQPGTPNIQLTIDDIDARFKREITVPVRINNPFNIKSFGFDLAFDSGTLEFAGIEIGSLLNGFTMVDANEISEGVVRVGGFSSEPIMTSSPSVLVRLKFRVSGRVKEPSPLSITNTFDDIKNAATSSGVVFYKEINNKIMRNKNVF